MYPYDMAMTSESYVVTTGPGIGMADTGCRKDVGGANQHLELQLLMDDHSIPYIQQPSGEYFQFGPGEPIKAKWKYTYFVGVLDKVCPWTVHEVSGDVPLLISPDTMASWDMTLSFFDGTDCTPQGSKEFTQSSSGHPCIELMCYPDETTKRA